METKYGFKKLTLAEFEVWIDKLKLARTIRTVQQHHTYLPNYTHFKGDNHFSIQRGMKNHHVNSNGWSDIGQHFTSFPDGTILTGRSLESSPACIYGFNSNSICIEHLGNFDLGNDQMTAAQTETAIRMTAAICKKFSIPINTDKIVYHHWFNLSTGARNNGTGGNKSCPGTGFFGGNKVADCEANFIPKVAAVHGGAPAPKPDMPLIKYVYVTASSLNIRTGPGTNFPKASDRKPAILGSNLRVYEIKNGWYKISSSEEHWVYGNYTADVQRGIVKASKLNARTGPGTNYSVSDAYLKGHELWIEAIYDGWAKVIFEEKWVSVAYLKLSQT